MHVRFSTCLGLTIVEEGAQEICGWIHGILLNPDTGKVEGFVVQGGMSSGWQESFLLRDDIVRWGKEVRIRSCHCVGPVEDIVRLKILMADHRRILGQCVRSENGTAFGRCADVQFSTTTWDLEWIFPRRLLLFWGVAISRQEIIEVTGEAVIVRDPIIPQKEKIASSKNTIRLEELVETPRPG